MRFVRRFSAALPSSAGLSECRMHDCACFSSVVRWRCFTPVSRGRYFNFIQDAILLASIMSPIIPSRFGHPKYNIFPQKSRATSLGGIKGINQRGTPGSDSKSRRKQRVEENKITIQPREDEDADNFYSKHLAAARFQRNHRLINVLFSEVVVDQEPNLENDKIVQANRQKRIKSLEEYKEKIDKEILDFEANFKIKKAKIHEDSKRFADKLQEFTTQSKKELESLRVEQRNRQEVRRVIDAVIESVANSV